MILVRTFTLAFLLLASIVATFAQSEPASRVAAPSDATVTIAISAKGVRFTALGSVAQLRLEVFNLSGQSVYNSDFKPGNVQDWALQDKLGQALPDGSYLCAVTVRDLSGKLRLKQGSVLLQAGQASLKLAESEPTNPVESEKVLVPVTADNATALTLLTHDGQQGRVVSGRGGLGFATGDFFAGKEVEHMRLTPKGDLGLGVENPLAKLDVAGSIRTSEGIVFPDGTVQTTAYVASGRSLSAGTKVQRDASGRPLADGNGSLDRGLRLAPEVSGVGTPNRLTKWLDAVGTLGDSVIAESNGSIGIGTTTPSAKLSLEGNAYPLLRVFNTGVGATANDFGGIQFGNPQRTYQMIVGAAGNAQWANKWYLFDETAGASRLLVDPAGNVGIGTTAPQAKLDVVGNLQVSGNAVVAGNIAAKYQDVAEWVPAVEALATGTVVTLDTQRNNTVRSSNRAYDTHVAGVVSAQPGVILGEGDDGKVLVATTGRVKVKVDATRHPIKIGDLLVSSSTSGVAMKSQPLRIGGALLHRPGTIIGKALEPLAKGKGEILVLLSLQ